MAQQHVAVILFLTDAVFTFFLLFLSKGANLTIVSELSLSIAVPGSYNVYVLSGIAFFAMFFSILSDSCSRLGRVNIILVGIASCFVSCFCLMAFPQSFMVTVVCVYFATSPVRNVLLLEQKDCKQFAEVRMLVFLLCYTRTLVRFAFLLISIQGNARVVLLSIGLVIFVLYYLLFTTFLKGIYYEPTFKYIDCLCLKCFFKACKKGRELIYKTEEIVEGKLELSSPQTSSDQLKKGISRCWFLFVRVLFPNLNVFVTKETGYKVKLSHWLCKARPDVSEFVIYQTLRFYKILPFVIFPIFFSQMSNVILTVTTSQAYVLKKSSLEFLDSIPVYTYFIVFKLVFYPFVEFMVYPWISKWMKKDVYFFLFGYLILLVSCVATIFLQFLLASELQYMPSQFASQLRIFNANNETIYVTAKNKRKEFRVHPLGQRLITDIPYSPEGKISMIEHNDKRVEVSFHLEPKETISYAIWDVQQNNKTVPDPNIFQIRDDSFHATFYIVTTEVLEGSLIFTSISKDYWVNITITNSFRSFIMEPGMYNVSFQKTGSNEKTILSPVALFQERTVYCLFFYQIMKQLEGKVLHIDGPLVYFYLHILPQLALLSLAHAFATVSFFRFLYLESPEKLRATVFGCVLALDMGILGLTNSEHILPLVLHRQPYFTTVFSGVHFAILIIGFAAASGFTNKHVTSG